MKESRRRIRNIEVQGLTRSTCTFGNSCTYELYRADLLTDRSIPNVWSSPTGEILECFRVVGVLWPVNVPVSDTGRHVASIGQLCVVRTKLLVMCCCCFIDMSSLCNSVWVAVYILGLLVPLPSRRQLNTVPHNNFASSWSNSIHKSC